MNLARFDLITLSLFVSVARHGSISAGARTMHLAIAAASKRISDLELALGVELFYRHSAGVNMTEAGQTCLQHALRILNEVEQLEAALSDYTQGIKGQIRLAANTSAITQFLSQDLAVFMREHPAIQVNLKEENSHTIVKAIQDNQADMGIFADRTPCDGLYTCHYRSDDLVLIVPPGHPLYQRKHISFNETLDFDYVGLSSRTSLALRLEEESQRQGKLLKLRIQVRGFDSICRLALATNSIGVLPRLAVQPFSQTLQLALVPLQDEWAHRNLLIGARDPDQLSAASKLLLEHLRLSEPRETRRSSA